MQKEPQPMSQGLTTDLSGQVAIITGGAGGLGRAFASALGDCGASLLLVGSRQARLDDALALLWGRGLVAEGFAADVTDEAAMQAMAQHAVRRFGRIDILVNNAAIMEAIDQPLLSYPMDLVRRTIDVNLIGPLNAIRAVAPTMREQRRGRIVNISSTGAYRASHAYGIAKLGLQGMTSYLAGELRGSGVTINAIAPGMVKTEQGDIARASIDPDKIAADMPLKPVGEPEDIVGALLYLCSAAADWTTGATIRVDGGLVKSVF
ncbi:MAG TPA: SDR family oxidoreductase [Sphingobium sp.]|nr:SDR family oxidoreductase [Sphingobium sp.]